MRTGILLYGLAVLGWNSADDGVGSSEEADVDDSAVCSGVGRGWSEDERSDKIEFDGVVLLAEGREY